MCRNKEQNYIRATRLSYIIGLGMIGDDLDGWIRKWGSLKGNTPLRGSSCILSFEEYMKLANEAGLSSPNQIGRSISSYQMGRIGDIGNYELGNCRFITKRQNHDEMAINGGNYNIGNYTRGFTKKDKLSIASMSDKISKDFILVSPSGETHEVRNLKVFCDSRGLDPSSMNKVCRGVPMYKSHKGWTGVSV